MRAKIDRPLQIIFQKILDVGLKTEVTYWTPTGKRLRSRLFLDRNAHIHRMGAPAYQEWHENGQLRMQEWWLNNRRHQPDGPAVKMWDEEGRLILQEWWVHGLRHRMDGPALEWRLHDGLLGRQEWWLEDEPLTCKQHTILTMPSAKQVARYWNLA